MNLREWLVQKYVEWERTQPGRTSYYNFAHYLDVNHTALTQWTSGAAVPAADDIARLANKLGKEIYALVGVAPLSGQLPQLVSSFDQLPTAFRNRLSSAIVDAAQQITTRHLDPESLEAKLLAVKIFERWGFHITG